MKKTYEQLLEYNVVAQNWLAKKKDNNNTKLGYAITKKMAKKIEKLLKPFADIDEKLIEGINDAKAEFALTEPTTKKFVYDILKDKVGNETQVYAYTNDGRIKREQKIKELKKQSQNDGEALMQNEVEFEPYYATEVPQDLTIEEKEAFSGIVIEPPTEK